MKPDTLKWIPMVPFDREWTDGKLFEYFNLSEEEQKLILEINKNNYDISSKEREMQDLKLVKVRLQGLVDKRDQIMNLEKC
jgi:hypothetical protein